MNFPYAKGKSGITATLLSESPAGFKFILTARHKFSLSCNIMWIAFTFEVPWIHVYMIKIGLAELSSFYSFPCCFHGN